MKRILITGAAGYVGTEMIKVLLERDDFEKIIGLDIRDNHKFSNTDVFEYIKGDIRDESITAILVENKIESVVHLASIVSPTKEMTREFLYSVDVEGTKNMLECCVRAGVSHFVVTSSGASYGYYADNPEWIVETDALRGNKEFAYSDHKRIVEEILADYRKDHPELKQLILRPGTVLGRTVNNQITDLFKKKFIVGIAGSKTPFVFIWDRDLIDIVLKGVIEKKKGIFNLAGEGAVNLKEIAKTLGKPYLPIPYSVVYVGMTVLKMLGLTQYGPEMVNFLRYRPVLLNKALKEEFGYIPKKSSKDTFLYYLNKKKNVFITGGSSGMGLELAKIYQAKGHTVGICSFENYEDVKYKLPKNLTYFQADVTDTQRMEEIINEFSKSNDGLDLVVANAGISHEKSKTPDFKKTKKVIEVNVLGVMNTFGPAIEIMKKQNSGQLAATSSIAGTIGGLPGMSIYGASKSAVKTMCESLEIDLHHYGIKVTTLAPGFIKTPLTEKNDHAKPFEISAEKAANYMFNALEEKRGLYMFPFPFNVVSGILSSIPRGIYKKLMKMDVLGTGSK